MAARPRLRLNRSGFQTYSGTLNNRAVKIRRQDIPLHGSFPSGQRQRRQSLWFVRIDGEPVGEKAKFSEARKLAEELCYADVHKQARSITVRAASVEVLDSSGRRVGMGLDVVRAGDRVRFLMNVDSDGLHVLADEVGDVMEVHPAAPGLVVYATTREKKGGSSVKPVFVRPDQVQVLLNEEDPRIC